MEWNIRDNLVTFSRFLRTGGLGRSLLGLLSLAFVLLLIVNLATFFMIGRTSDFHETVDRSHRVQTAARDLLIRLVDAETGQRGYLLTGSQEFLTIHDEAIRDLQRAQHHGRPDDPNRGPNIERLERRVRSTGDDLRRAERESEWAWRRLRGAPPTVEVQSTVLWPYIRHTVQKTLAVSAVATMRYGGAEVIAPAQFSRSAMAEDTDIEGANPQVGLNEDRLSLPDDSVLAASAGSALAEDIAAWGASTAHEAWARQLQASADELERQGRVGDAVEQRMAAAAYRAQSGE